MKIIDLLNKIARGEEVPKKFRYDNETFVYDKEDKDYIYSNGNVSFFTDYFMDIYHLEDILMVLNDEVKIIEEEKEIEKLPLPSFEEFKNMTPAERYKVTAIEYDKLNEIIDVINDMRDKE